MKINFGHLKNRLIFTTKNPKMRPTQGMAKSIIFNVLKINQNTVVLDLFAGTGSLGFEAASLGAKKVVWIDNNNDSIKFIKYTIDKLELDKKNFEAFRNDFRSAIKKNSIKFNLIFLDPPFIATHYYDEALKLVLKFDLLEDDGIIVLEKPKKMKINITSQYTIKLRKIIGEKEIFFLKK